MHSTVWRTKSFTPAASAATHLEGGDVGRLMGRVVKDLPSPTPHRGVNPPETPYDNVDTLLRLLHPSPVLGPKS
jgi:hypothetical protein